jgi:uncharacterized protein YecT (DUF1311 family)
MRAIPLIFLLLTVGCGQKADAQPAIEDQNSEPVSKYESIYERCTNENQVGSPTGLNNDVVANCSGLADEAVRRDLNAAYKKLYEKFAESDPYSAEMLEEAQKSWIVFRDNTCKLEGIVIGPPAIDFCHMRMNEERLSEIHEYFL